MNSTEPLVSIVVPSYNHSVFIEQCIESIVTQNYKNYELFVIDDGSTDGSLNILKNLQKQYGFYLEFNKNQGLANTLNRGFRELAEGKYLTFCASDDYWLQDKLQKQVSFMEKNVKCGMVYGKAYIIDEYNNVLLHETKSENKGLKGGEIFESLITFEFHPPVNYLFRNEVMKNVGFYRPDIWAEDFDMNLRISEHYQIGFIDDFISCYRRSTNSKTKMLNFRTIRSHRNSIDRYKDRSSYDEAIKQWKYRNFLNYYPYKETKMFALKNMISCLNFLYKKEFIKSFIKMLFVWK